MNEREPIALIGASGYAGEELLGLLLGHPGARLVCLTSRQHAGESVEKIYPRFRHGGGKSWQREIPAFVAPDVKTIVASGAKWAFLALPHGLAAEFAIPLLEAGLRVIDLSADFRLRDPVVYQDYYAHEHPAPTLLTDAVYGLPELPGRRKEIAGARLVAAPGCYPTSILLPLAPLLARALIEPNQIFVSSMSGVTGAGRKASIDLLHAEVNESAKAYGAPRHRHLAEIEQELSRAAAADAPVVINFTPHLLPINRGILSTIYVVPSAQAAGNSDAVETAWQEAYAAEPFVRLLTGERLPEIAHVVRTNFLDLAWRHDPRTSRWVLFSAEDNLLKGAAGQAVQCFNLMAGLSETTGLLTGLRV